jgi:hypothetical protein
LYEKERLMAVRRLAHLPRLHFDRVAAPAGVDPDVLNMENLDTDIPPPAAADLWEADAGACFTWQI